MAKAAKDPRTSFLPPTGKPIPPSPSRLGGGGILWGSTIRDRPVVDGGVPRDLTPTATPGTPEWQQQRQIMLTAGGVAPGAGAGAGSTFTAMGGTPRVANMQAANTKMSAAAGGLSRTTGATGAKAATGGAGQAGRAGGTAAAAAGIFDPTDSAAVQDIIRQAMGGQLPEQQEQMSILEQMRGGTNEQLMNRRLDKSGPLPMQQSMAQGRRQVAALRGGGAAGGGETGQISSQDLLQIGLSGVESEVAAAKYGREVTVPGARAALAGGIDRGVEGMGAAGVEAREQLAGAQAAARERIGEFAERVNQYGQSAIDRAESLREDALADNMAMIEKATDSLQDMTAQQNQSITVGLMRNYADQKRTLQELMFNGQGGITPENYQSASASLDQGHLARLGEARNQISQSYIQAKSAFDTAMVNVRSAVQAQSAAGVLGAFGQAAQVGVAAAELRIAFERASSAEVAQQENAILQAAIASQAAIVNGAHADAALLMSPLAQAYAIDLLPLFDSYYALVQLENQPVGFGRGGTQGGDGEDQGGWRPGGIIPGRELPGSFGGGGTPAAGGAEGNRPPNPAGLV